MKRLLLSLAIGLLAASELPAVVVRPAPDILWLDSNGIRQPLSQFKGTSVVILVAPSPRSWAFRSQVGQLQKMYQRYAADKVVCIAAFTQEPGLIHSNIPFVIAADGPRVAYDYQLADKKFGIIFIGKDGNVDYIADHVVAAQRGYDIIGASFVPQESLRRP